MTQLAKIGATVEWRQSLKRDLWDSDEESQKKDGDNEERFENKPWGIQKEVEKETLLSVSYQCNSFFVLI